MPCRGRGDGRGDRRLAAYIVPDPDYKGAEDESDTGTSSHLSQWQALYEETYGQAGALADPTFNITGWNSSYTGEPIPPEEMRHWVEQTVDRVVAMKPRRETCVL